jgi:hypothetical protein
MRQTERDLHVFQPRDRRMSHNVAMKSRWALLVLVFAPFALAACGGGKTAATTTPSTTVATAPTSMTIVVNSIALTSVSHDQPPKGASKGDSIVFTDTLRNGSGPQFGMAAAAAVKRGLAEMLKGGVIMDVVDAEQAKIAEDAARSR